MFQQLVPCEFSHTIYPCRFFCADVLFYIKNLFFFEIAMLGNQNNFHGLCFLNVIWPGRKKLSERNGPECNYRVQTTKVGILPPYPVLKLFMHKI